MACTTVVFASNEEGDSLFGSQKYIRRRYLFAAVNRKVEICNLSRPSDVPGYVKIQRPMLISSREWRFEPS